jgi:hypothetical protein
LPAASEQIVQVLPTMVAQELVAADTHQQAPPPGVREQRSHDVHVRRKEDATVEQLGVSDRSHEIELARNLDDALLDPEMVQYELLPLLLACRSSEGNL